MEILGLLLFGAIFYVFVVIPSKTRKRRDMVIVPFQDCSDDEVADAITHALSHALDSERNGRLLATHGIRSQQMSNEIAAALVYLYRARSGDGPTVLKEKWVRCLTGLNSATKHGDLTISDRLELEDTVQTTFGIHHSGRDYDQKIMDLLFQAEGIWSKS